MARLLRHWLAISLTVLVIIPVALVVIVMQASLVPHLREHIQQENDTLAAAITDNVEGALIKSADGIAQLGVEIEQLPLTAPQLQPMLDALAITDDTIAALYLVDAQFKAQRVGLPANEQGRRDDYVGLDFSGRPYIVDAFARKRVVWSDSFLSARGRISVGVAIPYQQRLLVGELDLERLSRVLRKIGDSGDVLPMIVDRQGHVVAHPDPTKSLQQTSLPLDSLATAESEGKEARGIFSLDGYEYIGSASVVRDLGWTVVIAQRVEQARAAERTMHYVLAGGAALALLLAMGAALALARAMTRQMDVFSKQIHAVATGDYQARIPHYRIDELNDLADNMRMMARAVLERESRIQASEAKYRSLVESTDDLITRVDTEGRFVFVNHASNRYFGLEPEACIGLLAFEFIHPDDRAATQAAFQMWLEDCTAHSLTWENRQVSRNGEVFLMQWRITPDCNGNGQVRGFSSIARDVTRQREVDEQLRLAASVFQSGAEGICITDAQQRILSINQAMSGMTGYSSADVQGKTPALFRSGRHDRSFYQQMWQELAVAGHWRGEIWNRRKNGEIYPVWLGITAVKDARGAVTHYIGTSFDISERKQAEAQVRYLAHHDALTNLPNQLLLHDRIGQALAAAHRGATRTALLLLDLDRFKLVNDTLGHDVGDRLLEAVAKRLRETLRETETVARQGGDEFVILVPNIESIERVSLLTQKIIDIVSLPYLIADAELHITPSIGITVAPEDGDDARTLLRNADTAMYHAKNIGRNNYQFFTQSMNQVIRERLNIENDLRKALERGEFQLYYQPQVDCRSGKITGMEALIRWHHPQRGLVPPNDFIPVAEETGAIVAIGAWVLREACCQASAWQAQGYPMRMGVNLSVRQFRQDNLMQQIDAALDYSGLDPRLLELEITEGILMEDPLAAAALLHQIADMGIRLAVDDFGTGYSSLAYLKRFPLHRLKIDRSFVRDISTDPNDAAIVNAIVAMADTLNMEVIAEGVEEVAQLHFLDRAGCCSIQGYYFSRPQPAECFTEFCYTVPPRLN